MRFHTCPITYTQGHKSLRIDSRSGSCLWMKIVTIDDAENVILGLQDEIRRSEESRYDHRLHGVLLVAYGMNCCQVADWVERFEEKGLGGLHEGSRSGRPSKLDAHQIADLQRVLRGKPSDVGLSGNLWDGKAM